MAGTESNLVSRPQFKVERLADRLLLSAVLEDGTELIDEVFTEQVPADEYVELGDPSLVAYGDADVMILECTMLPLENELIDPMPEEGGEEVYFGGEEGEDGIIYMVCGFADEDVILGDPAETLPDEVLMSTTGLPSGGAEGKGAVELAQPAPEQSAAPAAAGLSEDLLVSDSDLLGGEGSVLG